MEAWCSEKGMMKKAISMRQVLEAGFALKGCKYEVGQEVVAVREQKSHVATRAQNGAPYAAVG